MRVALYRNYREEQQQSMRIYADMLVRHLPSVSGIEVTEHRPGELIPEAMRRLHPLAKLSDFAGRYLVHPLNLRGEEADLHHVVDHGTAHLLLTLDQERTIVTCHDLVPLLTQRGRLPRGHVPIVARSIFRAVVTLLPRARLIITVSLSTKNDLVRELGCDPSRIHIVPLGLQDEHVVPRSADELLEAEVRLRLGPHPRILSVGGRWPHKNLRGVIETFARIKRRHPRASLLRIGAPLGPELWELARRLGLRESLHELGNLRVDDVACVYRRCELLLFPSYYEGFGWPPLEAMAAGTPIVASPCGSLPEVSGDLPLYADPEDFDGLGEAACRLLEDQALRDDRIRRGREWAARFTWADTARATADAYQLVLAGRGR